MAAMAQLWLVFGVKHGLDPDQLCAAAGMRGPDFADHERQIPHAWFARLRGAVIERLPEVRVGLELGRFASPEHFGFAGHALKFCRTPGDALDLLVRSCGLMDSSFRKFPMRVEATDEGAALRIPPQAVAAPDPPECAEAILVSHVSMLRSLLGEAIRPRFVRFAHARDLDSRRSFEAFFACDVHFADPGGHAVVFDRAVLERPIPNADATAHHHFAKQVGKLLGRLDEPFAVAVERNIEESLIRGGLSQGGVAKRLGMSTRSLQRRLRENGLTYSEVVASTRRSVAARLLGEPDLAIGDIAFALGYEDVRSFNRFFRSWAGVTPKAHREGRTGDRRPTPRASPSVTTREPP